MFGCFFVYLSLFFEFFPTLNLFSIRRRWSKKRKKKLKGFLHTFPPFRFVTSAFLDECVDSSSGGENSETVSRTLLNLAPNPPTLFSHFWCSDTLVAVASETLSSRRQYLFFSLFFSTDRANLIASPLHEHCMCILSISRILSLSFLGLRSGRTLTRVNMTIFVCYTHTLSLFLFSPQILVMSVDPESLLSLSFFSPSFSQSPDFLRYQFCPLECRVKNSGK